MPQQSLVSVPSSLQNPLPQTEELSSIDHIEQHPAQMPEPSPSVVRRTDASTVTEPKAGKRKSFFAVIAVILLKMKGLLTALLPALKLLKSAKLVVLAVKALGSSATMLLSIYLYAQRWGYPFAIGFVSLIFVHECGHVLAAWFRGIKVSLPYFIPGCGALILMKENPRSTWDEALLALGGPVAGAMAAFVCWAIALVTKEPIWLALAYTGFFINFFNLLPIVPLDGGRITGGISPRIWLVGVAGLVAMICAGWLRNPLVYYLILLSLPRVFHGIKRGSKAAAESGQVACTLSQKCILAGSYLGLCVVLLSALMLTHQLA